MIRTLTKNGTTLDLLAAPYLPADGDAIDLGGVEREWEAAGGPNLDAPRFGPTSTTAPRMLPFTVEVTGTDADDLAANRSALLSMLPDDSTPTTVTLGATGGSYTATATARRVSGLVTSPYTLKEDIGLVATVSFLLACDPYLTSATDTLYDATAVTLPAVVSLAAMFGDGDAPLDTELDFGALEVTRFFAGRYPDASATIADFVFEAVAFTWSGGSATTDAAGYPDGSGNTVWGGTGTYSAPVDVSDLEPGEYLALLRSKVATGGVAQAVLATTSGGNLSNTVTLSGAALDTYVLGVITLPVTQGRGSVADNLAIIVIGDTSHRHDTNTLTLIPASSVLIGWRRASGHAHTLASEDDVLYADDAAALGESFGGVQVRGKGGVLVMVAEQATPAPTTAADLTLTYEPRWEQLPTDGSGVPGPSM